MRVFDDARQCVVFFGVPSADGITYGGTGFLVADLEDGEPVPFLVTAAHVAKALANYEDSGFFIRVNTKDGKARELPATKARWLYHPDATVDLAITILPLPRAHFQVAYLNLSSPDQVVDLNVKDQVVCGDEMNIVGLFRLHYGSERNIPIVHSGTIAALPDPKERIPIRSRITKKLVETETYLVEVHTLEGLSGSPAFVHETVGLSDDKGIFGSSFGRARLLGVYVGSWDGEPGDILAADRDLRGNLRVPVGMGLVVPAVKLLELLRGPEMKKNRTIWKEKQIAARAATQDSATRPGIN